MLARTSESPCRDVCYACTHHCFQVPLLPPPLQPSKNQSGRVCIYFQPFPIGRWVEATARQCNIHTSCANEYSLQLQKETKHSRNSITNVFAQLSRRTTIEPHASLTRGIACMRLAPTVSAHWHARTTRCNASAWIQQRDSI